MFRPSTHGFHFDNAWPAGTPVRVGAVRVADAGDGLCGGMAFAAADLHRAGVPAPADRTPPAPGTPLFRYLVRRQLASLRLPGGVLRYYARAVAADRAVARQTIETNLPRVLASLDRAQPTVLGLVTVRSANPWRLVLCHQVLAYDHGSAGTRTILRVYDPNQHDDDTVTISLDPADPAITSTVDCGAIRGFFPIVYRYRDPRPLRALS